MCGRYDNLIAREAYRSMFKALRQPASNYPPRYNVAPTDQIRIVRVDPRDGERVLAMARWGLVPFWMKELPKVPHINARAETVHKLPLFREAFAKRRCLIPATWFFEWQKVADGKQPWRFVRKDLEPFTFAGIWEFARIGDKEILSASIIVGEPNPLVQTALRELTTAREKNLKKQLATWSPFGFPQRLWEKLVIGAGLAPTAIWTGVSNQALSALAGQVTAAEFQVVGKSLFKDEFVTCGGVRLSEIDFKTMQSRLVPGVPRADALRRLIEKRAIDGLSIGFRTERATREARSGQRRLWQIDLWEISIVTFPMLADARIAAGGVGAPSLPGQGAPASSGTAVTDRSLRAAISLLKQ